MPPSAVCDPYTISTWTVSKGTSGKGTRFVDAEDFLIDDTSPRSRIGSRSRVLNEKVSFATERMCLTKLSVFLKPSPRWSCSMLKDTLSGELHNGLS